MPLNDDLTRTPSFTAKSPAPVEGLPSDFDPETHPIICRHWFGIEPTLHLYEVA